MIPSWLLMPPASGSVHAAPESSCAGISRARHDVSKWTNAPIVAVIGSTAANLGNFGLKRLKSLKQNKPGKPCSQRKHFATCTGSKPTFETILNWSEGTPSRALLFQSRKTSREKQ